MWVSKAQIKTLKDKAYDVGFEIGYSMGLYMAQKSASELVDEAERLLRNAKWEQNEL